jgi:hypothetical protein
MSKTAIVVRNAVITLGPTTGGVSCECQITQASVNSTPNMITIPATGCEGQTQQPGKSSYDVQLQGLQDWDQLSSISQFLWDNAGTLVPFSIALDTAADMPVATGECWIVEGAYGGDFAAPLTFHVTLPCDTKPDSATAAAMQSSRQPATSAA